MRTARFSAKTYAGQNCLGCQSSTSKDFLNPAMMHLADCRGWLERGSTTLEQWWAASSQASRKWPIAAALPPGLTSLFSRCGQIGLASKVIISVLYTLELLGGSFYLSFASGHPLRAVGMPLHSCLFVRCPELVRAEAGLQQKNFARCYQHHRNRTIFTGGRPGATGPTGTSARASGTGKGRGPSRSMGRVRWPRWRLPRRR